MTLENLVRLIFVAIAIALIIAAVRFIRGAIHRYRMGVLYELEQKEKAIREANRRLTGRQLVDQANRGLGLNGKSKTNRINN